MEKINAAARGRPGSKCGCALPPKPAKKMAGKDMKKAPAKEAKNDKKLPPWLNKKAK